MGLVEEYLKLANDVVSFRELIYDSATAPQPCTQPCARLRWVMQHAGSIPGISNVCDT